MTVVFTEITESYKFSPAQFQSVREALQNEGRLVSILPILGVRTEELAYQALAAVLRLRLADLGKSQIDPDILDQFPTKLVHRYNVFPIDIDDNGSLMVATSNPLEMHALDAVSAATAKPVVPVVALPSEFGKLIKSYLGVGADTIDGLMAQVADESGIEVLDDPEWDQGTDAQLAQEASVVKLVNEILTEAVETRASDIHIEAQETGMKIRYRIDGVLQTQPMPPEINRFQSAIVSRLKIMAHLNIAEKRIPQDGRIKLKVSGREIDLRLSIIPMLHGEGIVMRILDKDKMDFTLRGVGMDQDIYEQFGKLIKQPHGIILVTGPTGSGKTTTLYSALNEIKDEATKIITTEDPIEYQLDGINQIQVHTKVGLTFATSLRAILRHDPDVVLVGEIRDLETAENAIQASLTGHLVFSTLHTNDAPSTITRLRDMGIPSFLITATVQAILAQRLVRTICKECREQFTPTLEQLQELDLTHEMIAGRPFYRGKGCVTCNNTGYKGRTAIHEFMHITDEIRELINHGATIGELRNAASRGGMLTLREAGMQKIHGGLTTIEEVVRETALD